MSSFVDRLARHESPNPTAKKGLRCRLSTSLDLARSFLTSASFFRQQNEGQKSFTLNDVITPSPSKTLPCEFLDGKLSALGKIPYFVLVPLFSPRCTERFILPATSKAFNEAALCLVVPSPIRSPEEQKADERCSFRCCSRTSFCAPCCLWFSDSPSNVSVWISAKVYTDVITIERSWDMFGCGSQSVKVV